MRGSCGAGVRLPPRPGAPARPAGGGGEVVVGAGGGEPIAVTIETPTHVQWLCLGRECHAAEVAVTGRAGDAPGDVNAVVEIDVVGETGNAGPADRLPGGGALHNRGQHGSVLEELAVAIE